MERAPEFKSGNAAFRKALNDVVAYAKAHGVNPGGMQGWQNSPDGWVPPLPGSGSDNTLFLKVYAKSVNEVARAAITPGVVTGLDAVYIPTIGATPIDDDESPSISISGTETIYLRIEIEPEPSRIPGSSPAAYEISESLFTVVNGVTVETDASDQQPAMIDAESGSVTQSGIFYIPLAKVQKSGSSLTVLSNYMYGPIGVKFCSSGLLAIAPPVFIHSGDLQSLP